MLSSVDLHSKKLTKVSVLKSSDIDLFRPGSLGSLIPNGNVSESDLVSFSNKMARRYLRVTVRCDEQGIMERRGQ
jgi:hypothetical protein